MEILGALFVVFVLLFCAAMPSGRRLIVNHNNPDLDEFGIVNRNHPDLDEFDD
jgi:hypothetical protein